MRLILVRHELRSARRNDQALFVVRALQATISRFSSATATGGTHCACMPSYPGSEAVMAPLQIARDGPALQARCAMVCRSSEYAFPRGEPPGDRVTLQTTASAGSASARKGVVTVRVDHGEAVRLTSSDADSRCTSLPSAIGDGTVSRGASVGAHPCRVQVWVWV